MYWRVFSVHRAWPLCVIWLCITYSFQLAPCGFSSTNLSPLLPLQHLHFSHSTSSFPTLKYWYYPELCSCSLFFLCILTLGDFFLSYDFKCYLYASGSQLTGGDFTLQGIQGNVWHCFACHNGIWRRCSRHLEGGDHGSCQTSYNAQEYLAENISPQRISGPKCQFSQDWEITATC